MSFRHFLLRLIAKSDCDLPMSSHHLRLRQDCLSIEGIVSSDLSCFGTAESTAGDSFHDLLTAWTRCIQIVLRVPLDLGSPALSGFDLVAEPSELMRKVRLINRGCETLRVEEASLLKCSNPSVLAFRHIEDHDVRMQLGTRIPIHWTSR